MAQPSLTKVEVMGIIKRMMNDPARTDQEREALGIAGKCLQQGTAMTQRARKCEKFEKKLKQLIAEFEGDIH